MADEDLKAVVERLETKVWMLEEREKRTAGNVVKVIDLLFRLHNDTSPIHQLNERTFRTALLEVKSDFENMGYS